MLSIVHNRFLTLTAVAGLMAFALPLAAANAGESAGKPPEEKQFAKENPLAAEWPCIARKVDHIDVATIWDGPAIDEKDNSWYSDEAIRKLSQYILSRRVTEEEQTAAVKKFAEGVPEADRDKKLALLFTAALKRSNDERKIVMRGIEKFHKRQVEFSKKIEAEGAALPQIGPLEEAEMIEQSRMGAVASGAEPEGGPYGKVQNAETAAAQDAKDKADDPRERLRWEMRVFEERQRNIPIACEIPGLLEERIGLIARTIRSEMSE